MERNEVNRGNEKPMQKPKEPNQTAKGLCPLSGPLPKKETRTRLRPPRYVEQDKSNKRLETSATKCKILAAANMKDVRKKSTKETKPKEEKKKKQIEEKEEEEEQAFGDGSKEKTAGTPSRKTDAITEQREEKEKGRDQQKPLHIPAATSPWEGEEKDATSLQDAGEKDHRYVRVRSLSEGDAVGRARGEVVDDEPMDEGEERQTESTRMEIAKVGNDGRDETGKLEGGGERGGGGTEDKEAGKSDEVKKDKQMENGAVEKAKVEKDGAGAKEVKDGVALSVMQDSGAGEEATREAVKSIRALEEQDLLDILSDLDLEDSTTPPPPPRRIRKRRTKAKSLGRQDTVVRQMLVRGSKRPPMFPPSADAWPGRL